VAEIGLSTIQALALTGDLYRPPSLVSRDSHIGYLTTSSPLVSTISASTIPESTSSIDQSVERSPSPEVLATAEPEKQDISPHTKQDTDSAPSLPMPGLIDKADTLRVEPPDAGRRGSISKLRAKSPGRRIKDVFSTHKSSKGGRTSPERKNIMPASGSSLDLSQTGTYTGKAETTTQKALPPDNTGTQLGSQGQDRAPPPPLRPLQMYSRPQTPPTNILETPTTTVTPPTPVTDQHSATLDTSSQKERPDTPTGSAQVVSPSGNMISHRRIRSTGTGSGSHPPSKLSNSITAPLTPTTEEPKPTPDRSASGTRNFTPGGTFFSSWVSAAQNAATSFSSLTGPNRSRSGTTTSDPATKANPTNDTISEEAELSEPDTPKKQLAIETLGAGDLNFAHLGIDNSDAEKPNSSLRPALEDLRKDSNVKRDQAVAKVEDMLAKRAVSAAYERSSDHTPVAELSDPLPNSNARHSQTYNTLTGGETTSPNGSIFEGEGGSVKRTNSVRDKLRRRSRGSSVATGASAIGAINGAINGASTATLANPATGPRLTGFAIAPKPRNRAFHQQFRSVPEDDYLIEDYSCALQKEILLAGRIYVSEGHICFSSNILGWVTTLVISFEEIVSIERENTAMIIPNAIAVQTLHARHTFRSLLSREATYDLMIGIWKVSHPASFEKSINGKQLAAEESAREATGGPPPDEVQESEDSSDEGSDEDDDDGDTASVLGSSASVAGSGEIVDTKSVTRKPSGIVATTAPAATAVPGSGDQPIATATTAGASDAAVDFPGPATHAPTDCTDGATHYDVIIKDETIPAPLGKVYSLLFGAQSGAFVKKFLLEDSKAIDLVLADDKKGLTNESKTRQYQYIKPLGGSIGPKQTKTITTETLDFFDLEKSVSVSCATQTPDVPSGSAFVTKTRYCLSWAPGNATRFQMNMTIEWSAKSWLKGPIEKGAKDGQGGYGDSLVKTLKATVGRGRATTVSSKGPKSKKKRKGERKEKSETVAETRKKEDWGLFDPLRGILGPVVDLVRPLITMQTLVAVLTVMVLAMWFRTPSRGSQIGFVGGNRQGVYEEMWRKEENELWEWLEDRVGLDGLGMRDRSREASSKQKTTKEQTKQRQKVLKGKDVQARLKEERMSEREMEDALRVTRDRLDVLQDALASRKASAGSV